MREGHTVFAPALAILMSVISPATGAVPREVHRTAVLIDATDILTIEQLHSLQGELSHLLLEDGEEVSLWVLSGSADPLHRVFRGRVPKRSENPLWSNPRRQATRWESSFGEPLRIAVASVGSATPSDTSPILESIRELTQLRDFASGGPRRLVVASDLRQHTPQLSFYGPVPSVNDSVTGLAAMRADLRGIEVEVIEIARPGERLTDVLTVQDFWRGYFQLCGAAAVRFERI